MLTALAALACMAGTTASAPPDPALFDANGYRTARYRSPVRADPAPAQPIALAEALALVPGQDALFIDVMPAEGGVRDPASGEWALAAVHLTIPGAQWFPETGRAPVDPVLWRALEAAIADARRTAPGLPVILFCRSDCWMSWNAARRLALRDVDDVRWLAEGTDGWHAAGRSLVAAVPVTTPALPDRQPEN
jgi:PQQ-dependent catabolism-associated CXXCW motif protein